MKIPLEFIFDVNESQIIKRIILKMIRRKEITLSDLSSPIYYSAFRRLNDLTVEDIKKIWKIPGDDDMDVSNIKSEDYSFRHPLYVKMVHRYNNCEKKIAVFWNQIDPNNQSILLSYVGLHGRYASNEFVMTEFFAWISNILGMYDIVNLEGLPGIKTVDDHKNSKYVIEWNKNPINFFYHILDERRQLILIERYNITCVRAYNDNFVK